MKHINLDDKAPINIFKRIDKKEKYDKNIQNYSLKKNDVLYIKYKDEIIATGKFIRLSINYYNNCIYNNYNFYEDKVQIGKTREEIYIFGEYLTNKYSYRLEEILRRGDSCELIIIKDNNIIMTDVYIEELGRSEMKNKYCDITLKVVKRKKRNRINEN